MIGIGGGLKKPTLQQSDCIRRATVIQMVITYILHLQVVLLSECIPLGTSPAL